ncbi:unnamed protein product [Owenia fusiformis]|uniref:Cell division cycle protein 16 homolog n=1 Tax=Owenia fusiformis TaxID=6347 RepID=A0A8S4P1J0_OWEFU|nr:unnamed protein product [Owenia fusiformis]
MAGEILIEKCSYLPKLREIVRSSIDQHQYDTALFWADKVVTLSNNNTEDIYWYAQTLYLTEQYHRASNLLCTQQLDKKNPACRYLAAKCHYECKEYQEAIDILACADNSPCKSKHVVPKPPLDNIAFSLKGNVDSSISLLRGKIYEAMDNRTLAADCFREALQHNVYCYEAFEMLVNHHMLTAEEERDLIERLPLSSQCTDEEIELVRFLYENKLKKYSKPNDLSLPTSLDALSENLDVIVNLAERHYYNCSFRECFRITSLILRKDPHNYSCLPLHIAVLIELHKSNALFSLAHKLVDLYPSKPVSWFAVGCYYLLVGKNEAARRYLSKATTLDRVFGPAWLAFGHSFAVENEHDQAMAAYFTASQLMKGCHLPMLYIGLEYGLTNNPKLAEKFFTQAREIAPEDPFVLHEMGVVSFQNHDWEAAECYFKKALEKIQTVSEELIPEKWEPLLSNLGHCCRKLKKYDDALEYHQQAMILCPQNPSTLSAIGYIHILTGNTITAVDYFHKALGLKRDDTFSTTMLGAAIEQMMGDIAPCDDVPDELPAYEYSGKLPKPSPDASSVTLDLDPQTGSPLEADMLTTHSNVLMAQNDDLGAHNETADDSILPSMESALMDTPLADTPRTLPDTSIQDVSLQDTSLNDSSMMIEEVEMEDND